MHEQQRFRVMAWWSAGRTGIAKSNSAPIVIHFTAPTGFGGLEGRWTPQDLLLCAVASCYTTTFSAVAEAAKFEYTDLQVEVEGSVVKTDGGYRFGAVFIRPELTIAVEHERNRTGALDLLRKAEDRCMVGHTLAVERRFEPRVRVGEPRGGVGQALPLPDTERYA